VRADANDNLALAVHANQDGALERLVRHYQDQLFGYALRMLRNPFDAQEVTQDAFLRAHAALVSRYDEERCRSLVLRPWLFRITRNLSLNRRRAYTRESPASVESAGDMAAGGQTCNPALRLETLQDCGILELALSDLDPDAREMVVLRYLEEMTYAEIAEILNRTEAAVRGKVFRALRKLRARLEELGYDHAM
jgi:RNA polymerase sigma-70 factor (ECF subfamily)